MLLCLLVLLLFVISFFDINELMLGISMIDSFLVSVIVLFFLSFSCFCKLFRSGSLLGTCDELITKLPVLLSDLILYFVGVFFSSLIDFVSLLFVLIAERLTLLGVIVRMELIFRCEKCFPI